MPPDQRRFASGILDHRLNPRALLLSLALLAAFVPLVTALDAEFYVGLANRILIFAIAATSLNLILGFGGMISFGHAAFLGIGGYVVAILAKHGVASAWTAWPLAITVSAIAALIIGAISLRTRGVYFIMITLALAQMLYYLTISLPDFGGDDGITLPSRSTFGAAIDINRDDAFFYVLLAVAALVLIGVARVLNSRFGQALQAIRENQTRMEAIGYPVYRIKLTAFTLAGALAGLAGALLVNQNGLVSPAAMHWSQSGLLMIMVVLGGVGHLYGSVLGATALLIAEELLQARTIHWQFGLGTLLLAVVLVAPRGLAGVLARHRT
jgi:branched-chain amino acid transport system permease protein